MDVDIKMNLPPKESKLPRNVKQVGELKDGEVIIYIEDYVYTYLYQLARSEVTKGKVTLLVGEKFTYDKEDIILVSGAVHAKGVDEQDYQIKFSKNTWDEGEKDIKKYFGDKTLVGWMNSQPQGIFKTENHHNMHQQYFSNNGQILLLIDAVDREERLYYWENDKLILVSGFFIYYDRNIEMHQYMLEHRIKMKNDEPEVRILPRPHKKVTPANKQEHETLIPGMLTSLSGVLLILCLVMGFILIKNNNRIARLEDEVKHSQAALLQVLEKGNNQNEIKGDKEAQVTAQPEKTGATDVNEIKVEIDEDGKIKEATVGSTDVPTTHKVGFGDTLGTISEEYYGTTDMVKAICELNGLDNPDQVKQGAVLKLPQMGN